MSLKAQLSSEQSHLAQVLLGLVDFFQFFLLNFIWSQRVEGNIS